MGIFESFHLLPSYPSLSFSNPCYVNPSIHVGSIAILSPTVVGSIPIYPATLPLVAHTPLYTLPPQAPYPNTYYGVNSGYTNYFLSQTLFNHAFPLSHARENVVSGRFMEPPQAPGSGLLAGHIRRVNNFEAGLDSKTGGSNTSKQGASVVTSQNDPETQKEKTGDGASDYTGKKRYNG